MYQLHVQVLTFCAVGAFGAGTGCSDHDQSRLSAASDLQVSNGVSGSCARSVCPNTAAGSGGATETDASTGDRAMTSSGAPDDQGGDVSTAQVKTPEIVGTDCLGSKADTQRHSAHCGQCGNACAPFVLASGLDWPLGIALNATTAFWVTGGNEAKVMSAPLAGGAVTTLADAQPSPMSIAINATHIYWAGYGNIFKLPLAGGTPIRLVTTQVNLNSIALDAQFVYGVEIRDTDVGAVIKVPLDGGDVITLATIPGSDPYGVAVDGKSVYWANGNNSIDSVVLKVPLAGGEPVKLASGTSNAYAIAVDATSVYWVAHDTVGSLFGATIASVVMKVPLEGGTPLTLATGTHMPQGLAIDRVSAYWTNSSTSQVVSAIPGTDGSVLGVPLAGGATTTLGPNQDEPGGIAANGETVCWTTMGSGRGNGSVKCLGICNEGRCP